MDSDTTNLAAGDITAEANVAGGAGVVAEDPVGGEQQFDEDGNPVAATEEDEDVEIDEDLRLTVPKSAAARLRALKEGALRQADYTRKTQDLAEQRRAFEAERAHVQQAGEAEMQAAAAILMLDRQLAAYANVDWAAEMRAARLGEDPDRLGQLHEEKARYDQAVAQRGAAAQHYGALVGKRLSDAQQETARRMEEGRAAVARAIPDWDQVAPRVMEAGITHYRFTPEELNSIHDPRYAIVLNDARQWREHLDRTRQAQRHAAAQQAQPAARAGSGNAVPPGRLDDRLSTEEWVRRRNEQARRGR